jgi:hypothetical protein
MASSSDATYATSVPGSTCTCRPATWITIAAMAGGFRETPVEMATGRRRMAPSRLGLRRDVPSFHRHQYNVERRIPRRLQNDSTDSPDPDSSSRRADHCSGLLRARMHARPLSRGRADGRPLGARYPGRIRLDRDLDLYVLADDSLNPLDDDIF